MDERKILHRTAAFLMTIALLAGCGGGGGDSGTATDPAAPVVVTTLADADPPPAGETTLRSALAAVPDGGTITFAPGLDGGTIPLSIVGEPHSVLKGETFSGMTFLAFAERDYGASALYARKNVTIDASALPNGITLAWTGGDALPARVLAVYGDLTMSNVTVTGGVSTAVAIAGAQPYTLARGAALAVWGIARLDRCVLHGNRVIGETGGSRDRGSFGGGIYGNCLYLVDCIVSGNSVAGYGAAGGGVYSVGGADGAASSLGSELVRCAVTGNRISGQSTYGGGIYSDGGGPGNARTISLTSCTLARNAVEDHPLIDQTPSAYYYRGGGFYMSNGYLRVEGCTIVENRVSGVYAVISGKPNMGGGAIGATIGNAHVVHDMRIHHSIIAGNRCDEGTGNEIEANEDIFTGSLVHFYSFGYNRIGRLDFTYILAPIPPWQALSRRHWPKTGDRERVDVATVLDLASVVRHPTIVSAGTDAGEKAVLWYPPAGDAVDAIPAGSYRVPYVLAEYALEGPVDDFLAHVLAKVGLDYSATLGPTFAADFVTAHGDPTGVTFYGPGGTWPRNAANAPWIAFWMNLHADLGGRLGDVGLGDDFWNTYTSGAVGNCVIDVSRPTARIAGPVEHDQLGAWRSAVTAGDIGAIEKP
jgi:hypothetical protein